MMSSDVGSTSLPPDPSFSFYSDPVPLEKDPFFEDESLYTNPVEFSDEIETKNDEEFTDEEVKEYYKFAMQENKRKICGCTVYCSEPCCRVRPNGCKDRCGCLCYRDNFVKIIPIAHPHWGYKDRDGDNYGPYLKSLKLTGGFDLAVDYRPKVPDIGTIFKMDLDGRQKLEKSCVKKMAVLAIKRYNKMFGGGEYRVLSLVKANRRTAGCGWRYFITFVAADSMGKGEPKFFQAFVEKSMSRSTARGRHARLSFERKVFLCRPKGEVFLDVTESGETPHCCQFNGKPQQKKKGKQAPEPQQKKKKKKGEQAQEPQQRKKGKQGQEAPSDSGPLRRSARLKK